MGKALLERYFVLFLYASILFVVIYLVRYDYVALDIAALDYRCLALSLLFLFLGFLLHALCWYGVCKRSIKDISLSAAIVSHGLSIFGKYIPGKVWAVFGRATYLARFGVALATTAQLSLCTLVLSVWAGLALGIGGLLLVDQMNAYLPGMLLVWALVSIFLFAPVHRITWLNKMMKRLGGEKFSFARFHAPDHFRILPLFFFFWLSWSIGFSFLLQALFPQTAHDLSTALAFPFATTVGIAAVFFPGGLGVREGCLVLYLVKSGFLVEDATLASIVARGWFVAGEVFMFLAAVVLKAGSATRAK